jgi:hypothetical protein
VVSWVRDGRSFFRADPPPFIPLLGVEVPVSIYTDGAEVQPDQLDALARFLAIPAAERAGLVGPLFDDYNCVRECVGEVPDIAGPEEVWAFVRWTNVVIPLQGPRGNRFVFVQGESAWEEEHGVELLFGDERLLRLDRASGLFLTTHFWSWS